MRKFGRTYSIKHVFKLFKLAKGLNLCKVIVLVFLPLVFNCATANASLQHDEPPALAAYYNTLESMVDDSLHVQIARLQDFVKMHPKFDRGYLKLLEKYILAEQILEAKAFFLDLIQDENSAHRNSHWMLAKIYLLEDDAQAALAAYTSALRTAHPSAELLSHFLKFDSQRFRKFNDPDYMKKLALYPETRKIATALNNYQRLEYKKAIQEFMRIHKIAENDLVMLYIWGLCHFRLAQYQQADSTWQAGLALSRQRKDLEYEAKFLMVLGIIPVTYQTQKGLSYFESAYDIAGRIADLRTMEYLAGNRAIMYSKRGEYAQAERLFLQVIKISKKLRADSKLAVWYSWYGNLLLNMKRFDEALKTFDRCESTAIKSNNERILIQTFHDRGSLYGYMGQNELARTSFQKAYNLAETKNLPEISHRARVGLGNIYFQERKYTEARKIFQEYSNSVIYKKGYAQDRSYFFIKSGRTYLAENNFELARREFLHAYEEAKKAKSDNNMIWALIYLAESDFLSDKLSEAAERYNASLAMATAKEDSGSTLPAIYVGLGNVHRKFSNLNQAITEYRQAAEMIEQNRERLKLEQFRIEYFVETSQVYENLTNCYYQLYSDEKNPVYLDSLYYYMEMTRGRTLRDLKLQREFENIGQIDKKQLAAYRQVSENLKIKQRHLRDNAWRLSNDSEWEEAISEIEIARMSLIAQRMRLIKEDSTSAKQLTDVPKHSLAAIFDHLEKRDLGLLFYSVTEDHAFALAIAGNDIKVVPLPTSHSSLQTSINSLITPFHHLNNSLAYNVSFKAKIAHQLYQKLVKPVEKSLALPENLLIVPDIALMNLPFEMLLTKPPAEAEYTPTDLPTYAKHFLLHRYAIVYSQSTTLLEKPAKWIFGKPGVLVFANPFQETPLLLTEKYPVNNGSNLRELNFRTGWRMEPLPFTEIEADEIAEISSSAKVYKRSLATKTSFLNEVDEYDVIHIATHGFVDTTYDAFSGLVFSVTEDSTDDGFLMGYEIADLKLDCDLVTLSACETGRGRLVAGEGVLGLPRLFLGAGAKSVLMTLWKVEDQFTSQLMPEFYKQYLNKNSSKVIALAEAKRTILKNDFTENEIHYQHPLFWASFVLYGDPGTSRIYYHPLIIIALLLLAVFLFGRKAKWFARKIN